MPKIVMFSYNFPHKKTQDFIFRILSEGYEIAAIYAADAVNLNISPTTVKTKISHQGLVHPSLIAKRFGIKYKVLPHNSEELRNDLKHNEYDLGIVSGARIIKGNIIECLNKGIINFHPGVIPGARGLDAMLWSIFNGLPLGVTSHIIDSKIDAGKIIEVKNIPIFKSDTILDLSERLYDLQLDMIPNAIEKAMNCFFQNLEDYGPYNKKMSPEFEVETLNIIDKYISINGK
ncbi:formyltransferase family protein [Lacihabitans sp. CS3-21]|uniref:formyltransferase family protein n=1 Tax=Lacihabitans sp. CS3-21 TaxID=2487332 RepID=UPI0020CBF63C|nr:formyltransferase family protein [Lacihabitans sp. CS3-21]MCP9747568.1 hypothetical protein [Lacihabitans sp. CS3-21]